MDFIDKKYHTIAYIFTALLFFIGLVFSKLILSISQFTFVGLLILEFNWKSKIIKIKQEKPALFFLSIYIIFVLGMIWTSNFSYGLHDLKIKLPLLLLPIVFVLTENISKKNVYLILGLFVLVIFSKTLESLWIIFDPNIENTIENISNNISHIRYSIFILFSIFSLYYLQKRYFLRKYQKLLSLITILWFVVFLVIIQSFTGIVIFILLLFSSQIYKFRYNKKVLTIIGASIIVILSISGIYLSNQINSFRISDKTNINKLEKLTENGNLYFHDTTNVLVENGNKVGLYQCDKELKEQWNKRSVMNFDSLDFTGYKIKQTLKRYLSSKGLRKDSAGIWQLNQNDIKNIEKGNTNYRYTNNLNILGRIYKTIWQIDYYSKTKNPNDQSITQRIEFIKTSFHIIEHNILIGVGTGDVEDSFKNQYITDKTKLKSENQLRAHNQIVTNILSIGIILGMWFLFAFIYPFIKNKKYKEYLPTIFFILAFLSMFTDDILETSISVGFISFFYSLLILKTYEQ